MSQGGNIPGQPFGLQRRSPATGRGGDAQGRPGETFYGQVKNYQRLDQRCTRIMALLMILLFALALGAYFSPIGSLLFLDLRPAAPGGGVSDICTAIDDCGPLSAESIVTDGLVTGQGNASAPFDIYNEFVTVQDGSTLTFAPNSSVICPSPDFLNDCVTTVPGNGTMPPMCDTDYANCGAASPFTADFVAISDELAFAPNSTVVCPSPGFLNDCVNEASGSPPTCDEHATCTNFLLTGADLAGGTVSLLVGADLLTSSGSELTVVNGATQTFESGSTLVFDAGTTVTCPTNDFLNDCVDETSGTAPSCAADYDQCNEVDPLLVGQINADDGIQMGVGSELEFLVGSSVTCPDPGFLNDCVDEVFEPFCDSFSTCTNFEVAGIEVSGGTATLSANANLTVLPGSAVNFASGSLLVCPSGDFLNDCVDEFGGAPPACDEHTACTDFEVTGMDVLGGSVDLLPGAQLNVSTGSALNLEGDLDTQSGSSINVLAGTTVTCDQPVFDDDSGCTSTPHNDRLLTGIVALSGAPATTSILLEFDNVDTTVNTLPIPTPLPFSTYIISRRGFYTFTLHATTDIPADDFAIELQRTHKTIGTGNAGSSAAGNSVSLIICQYSPSAPLTSIACTYSGYFHVNDEVTLFLNYEVQVVTVNVGGGAAYANRLMVQRLSD